MKRYPQYRQSGIDWLGEVPETWPVKRLKFEATLNPSRQSIAYLDREEQVSFLPMEAIGDDGSLRLGETRPIFEVENGYTFFQDGDVTIAKITPCFENGKGAHMQGLANGAGFGTTELIVVRPGERCRAEFLYYLTQASHFRKRGEGFMYGTGGQKRVPDDYVRDFPVAWPSPNEQADIAAYLEDQTRQVDALIADKVQLLELVAEYRAALFSRFVLFGCGEDHGFETLEYPRDCPSHWKIMRVKHVLRSLDQGWSPQCENYPPEEGQWGVLKVGCVNSGIFNPKESKALPSDLEPIPELALTIGDVLVSRANTRDLVGRAAAVIRNFPGLMLCDKLYRLRVDPKKCVPEFLARLLMTQPARSRIEDSATGASASMLNISQRVITELKFAFPPLEEQRQILEKLQAENVNLDELEEHVQAHIKLLREYKFALISEAVTGQIDVRGYAATSSEASIEGQAA